MAETKPRSKRTTPHWRLWALLLVLLAFGLVLFVPGLADKANEKREQAAIQPFYTPPTNYQLATPGDLLRDEPMDIDVPAGGQAVRIMYRSEREDGTATVSSGMIFFPARDANVADRPVVAWAHGTVGLGDSCAPSRSSDPLADMNWVGQMLSRGWIVVATDYAGLGTPGPERYLVGSDEARDVLNSVRAARKYDSEAGNRYALFGHSQGGHAALWSANESRSYAPELNLVGTAAGAPAAELPQLFSEQYDSAAAWVIGPDVTVSWPGVYPGLEVGEAVTKHGLRLAPKIARECAEQSGEGALAREGIDERYFARNPMELASWRDAASQQTPKAPRPSQPLLVVQSTTDKIVLPDTTATWVRNACAAGSNVQTFWMSDVTHQQTVITAGPSIVDWIGQRFEGGPTTSSCGQPFPV
jgi:pimeloyl-ACP methyl ester carboxylesterase